MEADYKKILQIGKWFLARQFDLFSVPKYKHICFFIGKMDRNCYSVVATFIF